MSKTAVIKKREDVTTIKVSSFDLIILSKVLADLRSRYEVFSQSRIMVSESRVYFAYINILNKDAIEALQELTPLGVESI